MTGTTLWTQDELAAAFALLLPDAEARAMAERWWDMFVAEDEVDAQGRYVHWESWGAPRPPEPDDDVVDAPEWHTPEKLRADELLLAGRVGENTEGLLLRLGDLHLALAALVSPELYERMRAARFMSPRGAARNRLQLTRAVRAYRRERGLPPVV